MSWVSCENCPAAKLLTVDNYARNTLGRLGDGQEHRQQRLSAHLSWLYGERTRTYIDERGERDFIYAHRSEATQESKVASEPLQHAVIRDITAAIHPSIHTEFLKAPLCAQISSTRRPPLPNSDIMSCESAGLEAVRSQ